MKFNFALAAVAVLCVIPRGVIVRFARAEGDDDNLDLDYDLDDYDDYDHHHRLNSANASSSSFSARPMYLTDAHLIPNSSTAVEMSCPPSVPDPVTLLLAREVILSGMTKSAASVVGAMLHAGLDPGHDATHVLTLICAKKDGRKEQNVTSRGLLLSLKEETASFASVFRDVFSPVSIPGLDPEEDASVSDAAAVAYCFKTNFTVKDLTRGKMWESHAWDGNDRDFCANLRRGLSIVVGNEPVATNANAVAEKSEIKACAPDDGDDVLRVLGAASVCLAAILAVEAAAKRLLTSGCGGRRPPLYRTNN